MSFWLLSSGRSQPGKCFCELRCLCLSAWDVSEPLLRTASCISCWVLPQACSGASLSGHCCSCAFPTGVPKPAVLTAPLQEGLLAWVILLILLAGRSQDPSPLLHGSQVHSSSLQPPWPAHSQQICPSLTSCDQERPEHLLWPLCQRPASEPACLQAGNCLHVYPLEGLFCGFID